MMQQNVTRRQVIKQTAATLIATGPLAALAGERDAKPPIEEGTAWYDVTQWVSRAADGRRRPVRGGSIGCRRRPKRKSARPLRSLSEPR